MSKGILSPKEYIQQVLESVKKRNQNETEFIQAVEEVLPTLVPVLEKHPEYIAENLLEKFCEPERQIMFRVPWMDDQGNWNVNRGFRVQFNGAIGPFKGGLRFQPSVYIGIIKFLGFEQILKNSLTGLPIGGGKGGADFDPKGKSDEEIYRFCVSFMTELYRYIGPDVDVPAGDMGVGAREVGYLYGQYRRIRGAFENGVLTGKGLSFGGSILRPEATGFGVTYFAEEVLKHDGLNFKGKTVATSGFGQVAWGICKKVDQLGGKVVTLSGPDGYIYDPDGVVGEKVDFMLEMLNIDRGRVENYAKKYGVKFFPGEKPWNVKADMIIPAAMQNDVQLEHAKQIVANGVKYYVEAANMPTTNEAIEYLMSHGVTVGPGKAANAGGVATSEFEMSQNSQRLAWTAEEVDQKLHQTMTNIYNNSKAAAENYGFGYNLVAGANIAGFVKVAEAMHAQGKY
ncbi:MAG: NADP-specific glutamate dehydrogenase [Clostridiales bacterium]|nr:NADP-specific glutamate dehydrogenase [Clostridiales bacterium]